MTPPLFRWQKSVFLTLFLLAATIFLVRNALGDESALQRFEYQETKMAVPVRIILYGDSEEKADAAAAAVYRRFDEINDTMSDWSPESEIVRVARRASETLEPVDISDDLFQVLAAARHFGDLSDGAFDITVSPVVKLWRRSRSFGTRPPADPLARAKELVGGDRWELIPPTDHHSAQIRVTRRGVRFDLGGIAKGFAIDRGFEILLAAGFRQSLLDAGGDMRFGDAPPGKKGWTISLASLDPDTPYAVRELTNRAVATSGDTYQFVEIEGVRYSHLIDPRSGEPLTERSVVTILSSTATEADALASAVSILGPEASADLIRQLPGVEAVLLTP